MSCPRPPTPQVKPLPVIHQALGEIPLTFFKLYAPSYRCPRCGEKGLFVKVSANDGRTLTEYWDIEGPRADFKNMKGLELHQGIGAKGGFRYEEFHESSVADHLDIFGAAMIRGPRLLSMLPLANLFLIDRQAPVGPTSWPQDPPIFRDSADVGVSGRRERGEARSGGLPPRIRGKLQSVFPTSSVQPAVRLEREGVRDDGER